MDSKTYNKWDVIVKIFGFVATATSIYIGINQFKNQQKSANLLEINKNFWQMQNQVYAELCQNAGAMAANLKDTTKFNKEKTKFLAYYYGELVLVEDSKVDSCMRELKSYIDIFEPKDPRMTMIFKKKVIDLANACRNSSVTFRQSNLK